MANYIVTGGGSGIGLALAMQLAKKKHHVWVVGRNMSNLKQGAKTFPDFIVPIEADLSLETGRSLVVNAVKSKGPLAGLIHNAATVEPMIEIPHLSLKQWRESMAINVEAPLFLSQQLLPQLMHGKIIHISSGLREMARPALAPYCVSKAALHMLYQCLNVELTNISVASVRPGIVDTAMQKQLRECDQLPKADSDFYQALHQQQKLVKPDTVARFLTWLLLEVDDQHFSEKEWDIYDDFHQAQWQGDLSFPVLNS